MLSIRNGIGRPALRSQNSGALDPTNRKQQPWWAVPTVFGIILVSSGIFVVLLAVGISILSNVGY
jgi:hypothetical protein